MRRRGPARVAGLLAALLVSTAACSSPSGEPTGPVGGETLGPDATIPIGVSLSPEPTGPESSSIAGYEGWRVINAGSADIGETETGFGIILTKQATWSKDGRGVLFYTTSEGDFRLSATVQTSKTSDSSLPPGGDGSTQLAGLMVRLSGSAENWLFLAVGADGPGLAVDVVATSSGQTSIDGTDWTSGAAELKVCRIGSAFSFWMRPADSEEAWVAAGSARRRDMTAMVQVGAAMSSDQAPDITALFDDLTVEALDSGEAC